jgi:hypothetical protein
MKNPIRIFIALVLISIFLSSCDVLVCPDKDTYLKSIEEFDNDLKAKKNEDVSSLSNDFELLMTKCYAKYAPEMSITEKKEVWKKALTYEYFSNGKNLKSAIDTTLALFKNDKDLNAKLLIDNLSGDMKEVFKDLFGDDINKAIDDVMNDINVLGDKLKEMLLE